MDPYPRKARRWVSALALATSSLALGQTIDVPLRNWTVPPYSARLEVRGGLSTMTLPAQGVGYVAMQPCRVVDTRNPNGPYGGPALAPNVFRTFDIDSGPCTGIPAGANAFSLNIAAVAPAADGFLTAWPTGEAQPVTSDLNSLAGKVIANAVIVPADTSGSINVLANITTHVLVDINGYFTDIYNSGTPFVATSSVAAGGAVAGTNTNTTNGSSGVYGLASGASGATFGVFGKSSSTSTNTAGVKGVDSAGELSTVVAAAASGVRGDSTSGVGVSGFSRTTAVAGSLLDGMTPGNVQAAGYLGYSAGNYGVYAMGDIGATGMKFFVEPHPTDANKVIRFVALEGPEAGTYFRGSGRTVDGWATIEVPESFRIVTAEEGLTVQLTPVGELVQLAVIEKSLNQVTVRASGDVAFDYEVKGVRRAYRHHEAIAESSEFIPPSPDARLPESLSQEARYRLIANGTYLEDGSVNLTTADRLGWTALWMREPTRASSATWERQPHTP